MTTNRYKYTTLINRGRAGVYDLYKKVNIPDKSIELFHRVQPNEADRLDLIAFNYYGNSSMWWIIAIANNIIDPFIVPAGLTLKIPRITAFDEEATK